MDEYSVLVSGVIRDALGLDGGAIESPMTVPAYAHGGSPRRECRCAWYCGRVCRAAEARRELARASWASEAGAARDAR